ncbi:ATP synthase subunit mitochondrial [Micractinium conductrix]|uniref:ATP synthase subunit mitochondrial n=1 Tax=Micractinium conductrix TaxID=554055 RepID=A0A2P6VE14_9CHLO|nr:ATP synthase subunit mitochondrial [Micractinium conductrix]|eukprot:PSC72301.1 ATP synthase subunit mitochondrial [Micractinium conductrix]
MLRQAAKRLAPQVAAAGTRGVAAAAAAKVKLPPQHGVPGRYAAALYMAAVKAGTLPKVEEELGQVASLMGQSKDFSSFVSDPSVPRATKIEGLTSVLSKMGATDVTKNFVGLLSDNNRLSELGRIVAKFEEIAADQRGEVAAQVTTAEGLSREEADAIQRGLAPLLKPGQKLTLTEQVDPSIIGGVILSMGDKFVDMSVLARVKKLKQIVRDAVPSAQPAKPAPIAQMSAEQRADGLRKAMEEMVNSLERQHVRPMQKEAYTCMAACCDKAGTQQDLQQCCGGCEQKVMVAQQVINAELRAFQERLQRCVQRCQDKAQEQLSATPSEKEIAAAQGSLAECAANCAGEYQKQVPKVSKDLISRLQQIRK